jgi:hypothetical protein
MDDDWQTAAFASRHMHNRVQNKSSKRNRPFDVHKTFGSYSCKCTSWKSKYNEHGDGKDITLELYRLSPNGEGILGEIRFPRALEAAVVLSGSRASLKETVQEMEAESDEENEQNEAMEGEDAHVSDESGKSNAEDPTNERDTEEEPARFRNFEKNSFRAPKFWIRWNGVIEGSEVVTSDLGYVVFSGNDCQKFKGTFTCEPLGWKDVAISGHKISGRGASDVPIKWNEQIV